MCYNLVKKNWSKIMKSRTPFRQIYETLVGEKNEWHTCVKSDLSFYNSVFLTAGCGNDSSRNVHHLCDLLFKERNPMSVMCVERRSSTAIRSQNTEEHTLVRSHTSVKHARNASLQIFTWQDIFVHTRGRDLTSVPCVQRLSHSLAIYR